ncbi:substrate-binding domain-containing protein [Butyrivibrio sp. XBB1001]|uniref:substrate-binding domain-containing protein n=1 Tax=Butyrivibrio sp. XBB1001 TaxID=1280682 RepID=UPI000479DCDD|nr:substrate-binding domain-containing protein [Butyrivibrio sp. XBB1001]
MKKKLVCYMVMAALAFSLLVGCSSQVVEEKPQEAVTLSSYSGTKVGVCIYQISDNFMTLFNNELVNYLVSKGFSKNNIIVYGSANSESIQLSQVEKLIDEGVDALIINPVNSSVARAITDKAVSNGIPLVYINREPSGEEELRWENYGFDVTYVGCDARQSGIYQGELVLDLGLDELDKNGDGVIQYFMIEGAPENVDAGYRTMYSVSTIKNAGVKMECLLDEVGNWDRATSKLLVREGLSQGLIPELVICNNDAMALGAVDAIKSGKLVPGKDIYVVGVDALPETIAAIEDGDIAGTVFNDYILQSHRAADAVMNYLQGNGNEHYVGCDYKKVSAKNAQVIKKMIQNSNNEKKDQGQEN